MTSLMLWTGLRVSETLAMQWKYLDFKNQTYDVQRQFKSKPETDYSQNLKPAKPKYRYPSLFAIGLNATGQRKQPSDYAPLDGKTTTLSFPHAVNIRPIQGNREATPPSTKC
jgi:integrase